MPGREAQWEGNRAGCEDKKWGGTFKWSGQGRPPRPRKVLNNWRDER